MKGLNDFLADFIFETGILSSFKRSGLDFLGSGSQNIASHSFRTAIIGYVLASSSGADVSKTVLLCLFHDIPETRTGDINYFQRKYVKKDEKKAVKDICRGLESLSDIETFVTEFNDGTSQEALLARDADCLELIFTLKEELDKGNSQALNWINSALKRIATKEGRKIAEAAIDRKYYDWWHEKF